MLNISALRKEYTSRTLDLEDLHAEPLTQFQQWLEEAIRADVLEPTAMILATASLQARPSSRTVLLKGFYLNGLIFYTNYQSRKGRELTENPFASATFLWKELERQVNVEGKVEKLNQAESEKYFATRPRTSQLGAWVSQQGQIVASREAMEEAFQRYEKQFNQQSVPMPPYWGGFYILPSRFEFWQGRRNRLHDRFQYTLQEGQWKTDRLAP